MLHRFRVPEERKIEQDEISHGSHRKNCENSTRVEACENRTSINSLIAMTGRRTFRYTMHCEPPRRAFHNGFLWQQGMFLFLVEPTTELLSFCSRILSAIVLRNARWLLFLVALCVTSMMNMMNNRAMLEDKRIISQALACCLPSDFVRIIVLRFNSLPRMRAGIH